MMSRAFPTRQSVISGYRPPSPTRYLLIEYSRKNNLPEEILDLIIKNKGPVHYLHRPFFTLEYGSC